MRNIALAIALTGLSLTVSSREIKDTVITRQNDRIILSYNLTNDGSEIRIDPTSRPRIMPSENLKRACHGELDKLKVVMFDRVGNYGNIKWSGLTPNAFMTPAGLSYEKSPEGYYILGECLPLVFKGDLKSNREIKIPLHIAIYEKKHTYKIVGTGVKPLTITSNRLKTVTSRTNIVQRGSETERIAIHSTEEIPADNGEITSVLNSIELINELLSHETEIPFSTTLQAEINNLISMKGKIMDPDLTEKINKTLLQCDAKEKEIKDNRNSEALAASAREQAMIEQEKQEAAARQQEAEKKAREAEEKQQKKTLVMIIGGVLLAILAFIGNAVFKHFRDIRNQKSVMQMQESLARQAQHEAGRRSREIVRNKTHQIANKGSAKLRNTIKNTEIKTQKNNKPRSI